MTAAPAIDADTAYRALSARDPRFDGRVWFGVTSTGIYCRPVCAARTPRRENVRVFASAAAAVAAGFRACRRCRPDAAPGTRDWDARQDLAARAVRLIGAGAVDEVGVAGLADRLHVSPRHLHRVLVAEVGVGPLPLALSRRAQTARLLLDQIDLAVADVAFAAGFASIRQFNDVMRREFGAPPARLRAARTSAPGGGEAGTLVLRLRWRAPYDTASVLGAGVVLAPAVVAADAGTIERAVRLPSGTATIRVALSDTAGHALLSVSGADLADLAGLVAGVRRWLDLDADPAAVAEVLRADPVLGACASARPGLRVPTCLDPWEAVTVAVVAQRVSAAAARTVLTRLSTGSAALDGGPVLLPTAEDVASAGPQRLRRAGLPEGRARALHAVAEAVTAGRIPLGADADPAAVRSRLRAIRGIGPWTAEVVAMRALHDPDAFPDTDLVLRRAAAALGLDAGALARRSAAWRPWRSYAAAHLWRHGAARPSDRPPTARTRPEEPAA